jgi:hypothetical protein
MAARIFRCGHQFSRAHAQSGRCQQAHHQFIAFESVVMAFSIAANVLPRNGIRMRPKRSVDDRPQALDAANGYVSLH